MTIPHNIHLLELIRSFLLTFPSFSVGITTQIINQYGTFVNDIDKITGLANWDINGAVIELNAPIVGWYDCEHAYFTVEENYVNSRRRMLDPQAPTRPPVSPEKGVCKAWGCGFPKN